MPALPKRIAGLRDLAYNLWWSWRPEAQDLFRAIDPDLWEESYDNPVQFLTRVKRKTVDSALTPGYLATFDNVMAAFDAYMRPGQTWFSRQFPDRKDWTVAYFSPEFGLHESLPIYSGGLGILAGDHCKEASDLGIPLVGVGFLYPQGYFLQQIAADGAQEAVYGKLNFRQVPAQPALTPDGKPVIVRAELPGRSIYAMAWRVQAGRVPIFLMDTDIEANAPEDRELSARLYGGDQEMRISQEIVLGTGGVRMLRALGIQPDLWHMNEGHSAFLTLERLREHIESGMSPNEARADVRNATVFTTHTPVPAGNDTFPHDMMERYFAPHWSTYGMSREEFLALARQDLPWGTRFSMTVLANRLSCRQNGVSEIHGGVSRAMWNFIWPERTEDAVPIRAITNGIHTSTWLASEMADLYDQHLGQDWLDRLDDESTWAPVATIPDQILWKTRLRLKQTLVTFVRQRERKRLVRLGAAPDDLAAADSLLDLHALTLGFARRFATYKRANLLFRDVERIKRLLGDAQRPVQVIFSGKAHPADEPAKSLIREVYRLSQDPAFKGKIVFIEEYDIHVARLLVQGVDVWLNNPRKPNEASGTSGQKAALNGVPNASVLDGWWAEAYNGKNGWAIEAPGRADGQAEQDAADSLALYQLLEESIIPIFYDRGDDHLPHRWLTLAKEAIRTVAPHFSTRRMLKDYVRIMYIPAEVVAS